MEPPPPPQLYSSFRRWQNLTLQIDIVVTVDVGGFCGKIKSHEKSSQSEHWRAPWRYIEGSLSLFNNHHAMFDFVYALIFDSVAGSGTPVVRKLARILWTL